MMFNWCAVGQHDKCLREYAKFYFVPPTKKNKTGLVITDELAYCQCTKRGCKCYVPTKDRDKVRKKRRK